MIANFIILPEVKYYIKDILNIFNIYYNIWIFLYLNIVNTKNLIFSFSLFPTFLDKSINLDIFNNYSVKGFPQINLQ